MVEGKNTNGGWGFTVVAETSQAAVEKYTNVGCTRPTYDVPGPVQAVQGSRLIPMYVT